jgi:hypothetical protein
MIKDIPVISFDEESIKFIEPDLVPLGLKGLDKSSTLLMYRGFESWLKARTIPIARIHAKRILNTLNLPQVNLDLQVILACKGLSFVDSFWVKEVNSKETWKDVNLFKNSFSEGIGEIAFTGVSNIALSKKFLTPELSGQGAYAKCWKREGKKIYLYKSNTENGKESEHEYICSTLLDILEYPHIKYELCFYKGRIASKCELMTSEDLSIVPMLEVDIYLKRQNINTVKWVEDNFKEDFYKMLIFDALVHNTDRHWYNWGIYRNVITGKILGLHPLFDHNCAFDMSSEQFSQVYPSRHLIDVGNYAVTKLGNYSNLVKLYKWLSGKRAIKLFKNVYGENNKQYDFVLKRVQVLL